MLRHQRTTVVADRLGLSQSAVSHALSRLRELFDDPLFSRRPDGLTPTRRALELAPRIRDLMRVTRNLINSGGVFEPATSARQFRLAANDLVATLFGPPLVKRLADEAPATRLATRFAVGKAALDALRKDELDLAIGRFYGTTDEFLTETLVWERFSVVARQGHPRIADALDLALYLDLEHLLVSFSGGFSGAVDEALSREGITRRVRASVPMFLTAFAAVAASDLIATVPARLARQFGAAFGLQVFDPPLTIDAFPISLARHVSTETDPGLTWLVERVRAIAATLD
ncbi:LysR family transcriptional regulator [Pleomorphomonas oryzae]|uniref:LysR family transcriptional regulator n=1 Tax=Pleomorphomonas oryzae TaxID=261934 RepID=UPI003CCC0656